MYEILKNINGPGDIKKLSLAELNQLAGEIREGLFNRLTHVGGHCGPNFGFVEATIALHYVFDSPHDKFVFDVSHQSYAHKMLTGRRFGYIDNDRFAEDSGYSNPHESEHDLFNIGHTSTSVSLATGLAKARDLLGRSENVIAVIGDGSLSGGEAMEGLNVAGSEINGNLIIVVNDNQQSISETHGGLYKSLADLRASKGASANNIFKAFGLDYVYEDNGNDIASLIKVFLSVKDIKHPVVVHINTTKGKGFALAEQNKEAWHWTVPFNRDTGLPTVSVPPVTYTSVAREYIMRRAETDDKFVLVTPNMPGSFGFTPDLRAKLGSKFVDVGIAEEQAVAMASGLAKGGANPLIITNTTFMQRAYDQLSQDLCINGNAVTILLNYANFDGLTDVTHLGIFGISAFSNIPNLTVLAPSNRAELVSMLDWSFDKANRPVIILMPGNAVTDGATRQPYDPTKYNVTQHGEKVAVITLGDFYAKGQSLAEYIEKSFGFTPTLADARNASTIDAATLDEIAKDCKVVVTLEDGILDGGLGQKIAAHYATTDVKVLTYGLNKVFYDRYDPNELLKSLGITNEQMTAKIADLL